MVKGERVAATDPVEALAGELRLLLRKGATDLVDPIELAILHRIILDEVKGYRPRVMSLQPVLELAIAEVADPETRMALETLLGHSDLRYRSMKERGTKAAKIVGVGYDAYRRAKKGRIQRDLLVLASQIVVQHPGSLLIAGIESDDVAKGGLRTRANAAAPANGVEQQDLCEFCGSDPRSRTINVDAGQ